MRTFVKIKRTEEEDINPNRGTSAKMSRINSDSKILISTVVRMNTKKIKMTMMMIMMMTTSISMTKNKNTITLIQDNKTLTIIINLIIKSYKTTTLRATQIENKSNNRTIS